MTPHEKITAAVTLILLLAGGIGYAYHWWVNDWRYWFGGLFAGLSRTLPPLDLPGPATEAPARAGEVHWTDQDCPDDAPDGSCWDCQAPKNKPHQPWCPTQLDPDQAADQLIAEWHSPDLELTAEDWIARDLADLELLAWDARVQAARCWEIVHVEFPRLRAELCAA